MCEDGGLGRIASSKDGFCWSFWRKVLLVNLFIQPAGQKQDCLPFVRVQVFSRSLFRPWMKMMLCEDGIRITKIYNKDGGNRCLRNYGVWGIVDDFEVVSACLGDEGFGSVSG